MRLAVQWCSVLSRNCCLYQRWRPTGSLGNVTQQQARSNSQHIPHPYFFTLQSRHQKYTQTAGLNNHSGTFPEPVTACIQM